MTRRPEDPTTPKDTVLGHISCGGVTETALVARVMSHHRLTYEWAEEAVKNALTELLIAKRIEQVHPGVSAYQLTATAKFEDKKPTEPPAKTIGGYRNYVPPAKDPKPGEDVTPRLASPCIGPEGE